MYIVTFREKPNSPPIVVHNPFVDGVKLLSGNINQGVNNIDSFDLEIDFSNIGYKYVKPMQTLVEVRNIKNNYLEFSGRLLNYSDNMSSDGLHTKAVICEGVLGYLHDSHQPYIDFTGNAEDMFIQLIDNHNSQVEEYKQFVIGTVSLKTKLNKDGSVVYVGTTPASTNTTAFITPEETTYDAIKTNLLDVFGGEIQVRSIGAIHYIDYVQSIGHDSLEDISISRNLRSVTKKVDPSNIVTRLIPLGKTITTEVQNDNERRTTIQSANNGLMYIERSDLKEEFGIQTGSVIWEDVTDPAILMSKGNAWLYDQKIILQQFTVEALDLFKIGKGIEEYSVGNTHNIVNPIMSLNERIRIITKKVDIVTPFNSSLTIGDKFKTMLDYQVEQRNTGRNVTKIQRIVDDQQGTITGMSGRLDEVESTLETISYGQGYTHTQTVPSTEWIIDHSMGRYPSVTVVDSGGSTVYGDVRYVSDSQVILTFSSEFSGKAYLN